MINNANSKVTYNLSGNISTNYSFNFKIFEPTQIQVLIEDTEQIPDYQLLLILNSDYTVNNLNNEAGGFITLTQVGLMKINNITKTPTLNMHLSRSMPFVQTLNLEQYKAFNAELIEKKFDELVMTDQQLRDQFNSVVEGQVDLTYINNLVQEATDASNTAITTLDEITAISDATIAEVNSIDGVLESVTDLYNQIHNLSTTAVTLSPNSQATSNYDPNSGLLTLGIPRGVQGIQGPIGPQGIRGETGPQGGGLDILGHYDTEAELPTTGVPGNSYLVGTVAPYDLYIWDSVTNGWINEGSITGPAGPEGPQGPAGHDALSLVSDLNLYLSTSIGDDTNDGLTPTTQIATWERATDILSNINPGKYNVILNLSGKLTNVADFKIPRFTSSNFKIIGTDTSLDGFSNIFRLLSGGFEPNNISFGQLQIGNAGNLYVSGKTIRFTGLVNPSYAIGANTAGGTAQFSNCTIEYAGIYSYFLQISNMDIGMYGCTFTNVGSSTVNSKSIKFTKGGTADISNLTSLPGGGTYDSDTPGLSNYTQTNPIIINNATNTVSGISRFATQTEINTGTLTNIAVDPLGLNNFINTKLKTKLTVNTNYYIDAVNGNDNNNGLTAATAFATYNKASTILKNIDGNGYSITLNFAAGSYGNIDLFNVEGLSYLTYKGAGPTTIFNATTNIQTIPVIQNITISDVSFAISNNSPLTLNNIKNAVIKNITFNSSVAFSYIILSRSFVIFKGYISCLNSTACSCFVYVNVDSYFIFENSSDGITTLNFPNGATFNYGFIWCSNESFCSTQNWNLSVVNGTVNGPKYREELNSYITTKTGLPGTTNGYSDRIQSQSGNYNVRTVLTTSGTFVAPFTSYYKVTCIGGGGNGGIGGLNPSPFAGPGGGGGAAGYVQEAYLKLTANQSIAYTIGSAGGTTSFGTLLTATGGPNGNPGGTSTSSFNLPGTGGKSIGSGGNGGQFINIYSYKEFAGQGGVGGSNGTLYGGGGGGGSGRVGTNLGVNAHPGIGGSNGSNGNYGTTTSGGSGGPGGPGAIIIEYFNPSL